MTRKEISTKKAQNKQNKQNRQSRCSLMRAARRSLTYLYTTHPVSQNCHESLLRNTKVVGSLMKDSGRHCRIIASANFPIAFSLFGRFPQLITFLGLFEQLISQSIHQMPLAKYSKIDMQVWHTTRILLSDTPTSSDRRGGWEPRGELARHELLAPRARVRLMWNGSRSVTIHPHGLHVFWTDFRQNARAKNELSGPQTSRQW